MKRILFISALIIFSCFSFTSRNQCILERNVFDVGSGSLKVKSFLVDTCSGKIEKELYDYTTIDIQYQVCMNNSGGHDTVVNSCVVETNEFLSSLTEKIDCSGKKCKGVATAWARKANNFDEIMTVFKKYNIELDIISQHDEALLGYYASIHGNDQGYNKYCDEKKGCTPIMLEMGGGSFQIVFKEGQKFSIYSGLYGLESVAQLIYDHYSKYLFKPDEIDGVIDFLREHLFGNSKPPVPSSKDNFLVAKGLSFLGTMRVMSWPKYQTRQAFLDGVYAAASAASLDDLCEKYPNIVKKIRYLHQIKLLITYVIMEALGQEELYVTDITSTIYLASSKELWRD